MEAKMVKIKVEVMTTNVSRKMGETVAEVMREMKLMKVRSEVTVMGMEEEVSAKAMSTGDGGAGEGCSGCSRGGEIRRRKSAVTLSSQGGILTTGEF